MRAARASASPATPAAVRRFVEGWHRAECWLAVGAFAFIALVLLFDVAGRELLGPLLKRFGIAAGAMGIFGAQKMAVFALVIGTYSGIGIAAATASHLVPRVGFGALPAAWNGSIDRLADLLTGLFLLGAAWYGVEFVGESIATGLLAPMLQWPVWPFQLAIPLGFASAALAGAAAGSTELPGMTALPSALLPVGLVAALLVLRQPLIVILLALLALVHLVWGRGHLEYIIEDLWIALDKELILSIPLFLLCGQVMTRGSTARRLIRIMKALTPRLPGGLAVACILGCAVDASISGSSIVTMLAIGSVMVPAMLKSGYERRFTLGAVMSGGTLGIIIPPSIPMIIYALVTETSITDLFAAGIGPGLLLALVFALYAVWVNRHMPTAPFNASELLLALRDGVWAALLPVVLLGGIYSGFFSITEAAAVALAYAMTIEVVAHKELKPKDFYTIVLEAARFGGALFPVLAIAVGLSIVLTEHRVPATLVRMVVAWIDSPLAFIVLVNLLLLAVGCLMTIDTAILVLAPLLAPIAMAYGYDKVLFGIIMILNLEIGYLTPPVGLNLIVAVGAFKQPFGLLCQAALPFIVLMLLCLALVVWQPWIALQLVK